MLLLRLMPAVLSIRIIDHRVIHSCEVQLLQHHKIIRVKVQQSRDISVLKATVIYSDDKNIMFGSFSSCVMSVSIMTNDPH
jgi:hypothetical protein